MITSPEGQDTSREYGVIDGCGQWLKQEVRGGVQGNTGLYTPLLASKERDGGKDGRSEGERKEGVIYEGREGGSREGGREGRKGGRKGGRERGREGEREGAKEEGRKEGRKEGRERIRRSKGEDRERE